MINILWLDLLPNYFIKMHLKKLKGKGYKSVNVISHNKKNLVVFGPYNTRNIDKELNTIQLKLEENEAEC